MIKKIPVSEFLVALKELPVLDARSEGEFEKGHIPGAVSFPLLNNSERAAVGKAYKREGREKAVYTGFKLTGHKFADFVSEAEKMFPGKKILIYCWRGGMRSNTMAWILNLAGFKVTVLEDGYKAYRKYVLTLFEKPFNILILGGKTGVGKTEVLNELKKVNEQVIDLEGIANHKGSAFGALGQSQQPTYEQFENILAYELFYKNSNNPIWIENESRLIGSVKIPDAFYSQMRSAPVIELKADQEQRIKRIVNEYGAFPKEVLIENTLKLAKRLGDQRTTEAVEFLNNNEFEQWVEMVLNYYDKTYEYGMSLREAPKTIPLEIGTMDQLLRNLLNLSSQFKNSSWQLQKAL